MLAAAEGLHLDLSHPGAADRAATLALLHTAVEAAVPRSSDGLIKGIALNCMADLGVKQARGTGLPLAPHLVFGGGRVGRKRRVACWAKLLLLQTQAN